MGSALLQHAELKPACMHPFNSSSRSIFKSQLSKGVLEIKTRSLSDTVSMYKCAHQRSLLYGRQCQLSSELGIVQLAGTVKTESSSPYNTKLL